MLCISLGLATQYSVVANAPALVAQFDDRLYDKIQQQYGDKGVAKVHAWRALIDQHQQDDEWQNLTRVNDFFNANNFVNDIDHWQQDDYWATPLEFMLTGGGDCEDFSIAKYFTLRALGIPTEKLRLMYVTALEYQQAHMVLIYFESPKAMPVVLDNINPQILPANQRPDLAPVYSFNGDGLWLSRGHGEGRPMKRSAGIAQWEDVINKIERGL